METTQTPAIARVVGIWRYPVKSMLGEELKGTDVTEHGLLGDRGFALIDLETGKVVSAKNPRRWPTLFSFRANYVEPPRDPSSLPPVRITLPGGQALTSDQADVEPKLSAAAGRPVRLARQPIAEATAEGYWPDYDWLKDRDQIFDFPLPPQTFFDGATIHLITTATLKCLGSLSPTSRFEIPRFRPNFVIEPLDKSEGFIETEWIGRSITVGEVRLRIDGPCPRCVMTTLAQGNLPKDPAILQTAVQNNSGNIGVYATVEQAGHVRRNDGVTLCQAP